MVRYLIASLHGLLAATKVGRELEKLSLRDLDDIGLARDDISKVKRQIYEEKRAAHLGRALTAVGKGEEKSFHPAPI